MQHEAINAVASLSRKQLNQLGCMCMVLMIEFTLATGFALRALTGEDWTVSSLLLAFLLVCQVHGRLEKWLWGTASE
jgi:hypothetical protein